MKDYARTEAQGVGAHVHLAAVLTRTELEQAPLQCPSQTEKLRFSNEDLLVQGISLLNKDLNPGLFNSTAQTPHCARRHALS